MKSTKYEHTMIASNRKLNMKNLNKQEHINIIVEMGTFNLEHHSTQFYKYIIISFWQVVIEPHIYSTQTVVHTVLKINASNSKAIVNITKNISSSLHSMSIAF